MTSLYEQYQIYLTNLNEAKELKYVIKTNDMVIFEPEITDDFELNNLKIKPIGEVISMLTDNMWVIIKNKEVLFFDKKTYELFKPKGNPISDLTPISTFDFYKEHNDVVQVLKPHIKTTKGKIQYGIMESNMTAESLDFADSHISELPNGLTVNGNLDLSNCKMLKELPEGLKISKNLYIVGSAVKELPEDIQIQGKIDVTQGTRFPENLKAQVTVY